MKSRESHFARAFREHASDTHSPFFFFLERLAFAVRAPTYDTNRSSIVRINDYFHPVDRRPPHNYDPYEFFIILRAAYCRVRRMEYN